MSKTKHLLKYPEWNELQQLVKVNEWLFGQVLEHVYWFKDDKQNDVDASELHVSDISEDIDIGRMMSSVYREKWWNITCFFVKFYFHEWIRRRGMQPHYSEYEFPNNVLLTESELPAGAANKRIFLLKSSQKSPKLVIIFVKWINVVMTLRGAQCVKSCITLR